MGADLAQGRDSPSLLVAVGAGAGVLSGLFGVGGGILMVPALVLLLGLGQHRAHATSLAAIVPIAAVGALVFGRANSVDLVAAALLATGSLLGVQAGARVMNRLSDDRLALVFGGFMIVLALAMLFL
jgi:uncharacterized protein